MVLILLYVLNVKIYPVSIAFEILYIGKDSTVCGLTYPVAETQKKLGLILWFHGGMNSDKKDKGAKAHLPLLSFVDSGAYILTSPSAYKDKNWLSAEAMVTVKSLVDSLIKRFPIDMTQLHLVGVSDGSLAVILYSQMAQHPVQNRLLFSSYPEILLSESHLEKPPSSFSIGKWFFFQGEKDRLFPAKQVFPFLKQWKKNVTNTELILDPEGQHDFSYWAERYGARIRTLLK